MYILLQGQQYLTVLNATTRTDTDEEVYDGEPYRNLLPAGYLGRAWASTITPPLSGTGEPEAADDIVNAVPPWPLKKTRTMFTWTDGASTVGECWADQYIGISSAPPKFST